MAADPEEVGHSKPGVASFFIGIGVFISCVLLVLIGIKLDGDGKTSEFEDTFMIFGVYYVLVFAPIAHFAGLLLGGAGWLQKKRRKGLATAGFFINLLFVMFHLGIRGFFSSMFFHG